MSPLLRNILAFVAGLVVGNVVNMSIIMVSGSIIPPPVGVDPNDMESIKASMHLYEAKHFVMPFLAHALGTLVGAFVACKLAITHHLKLGLGMGVLFLIGGIMMVFMLPSPLTFTIIDLVLSYLPMGWLGYKLSGKP